MTEQNNKASIWCHFYYYHNGIKQVTKELIMCYHSDDEPQFRELIHVSQGAFNVLKLPLAEALELARQRKNR